MLTDTKFHYLGVMKNNKNQAVPAQGAEHLTQEQIKAALERDFKALHALLNMVRSEPRIMDVVAQVVHENRENHKTVKQAQTQE